MGKVVISAEELARLKTDTQRQQQNLVEVIQQVESAVRNRDWESAAATSFEARWTRDKGILMKLRDSLQGWMKELQMHHDVATDVNQPFR